MKRGTTPTLIFKVPFDTSLLSQIYITMKQGTTTLEKTLSDCTLGTNTVSITLTQAETLSFNATDFIEIQLRVKYTNGSADASQILLARIGDILKGGTI